MELFAADGHDAGGCERVTGKSGMRPWLAAHPRFHLHFTPTYASWLNQVERWFGLLSQRAIKRGSFRSVADLVRKIQAFIDSYNASATPFVWVATAQSIIDKVERIAMRISGTAHYGAAGSLGVRLMSIGPRCSQLFAAVGAIGAERTIPA